jgi:hypothetical protein
MLRNSAHDKGPRVVNIARGMQNVKRNKGLIDKPARKEFPKVPDLSLGDYVLELSLLKTIKTKPKPPKPAGEFILLTGKVVSSSGAEALKRGSEWQWWITVDAYEEYLSTLVALLASAHGCDTYDVDEASVDAHVNGSASLEGFKVRARVQKKTKKDGTVVMRRNGEPVLQILFGAVQ